MCSSDLRNIGRDNETAGVLTLKELADFKADMFTTVYIGNSHTKIINGKMLHREDIRLYEKDNNAFCRDNGRPQNM